MALRIADVNALPRGDFLARFGDVAEHSPWVAERAEAARPFADLEAMVRAFHDALDGSSEAEQVALLRAHPDLAGRAARAGALTADSRREQAGAGLDSLSEDEFARLHELNDAYKARFGFPFILAVKGATKAQVLASFEARLNNTRDEELATALGQVKRIIRFRLEDRIAP